MWYFQNVTGEAYKMIYVKYQVISDWSVKWEMPFNVNKCQILQVGSRNIKDDYEMRGDKIKRVHSVKDLGVTVASNLKFSQQCNEIVKIASRMMGLIKRKISFKSKDVVLPLYNVLVKPHYFRVCRAVLGSPPCKRHCQIRC